MHRFSGETFPRSFGRGAGLMPTSALQYCAAPNCRALVRKGRCEAHARPAWSGAGGTSRASAAERGYDATYRRNRAIVLRRDPVCLLCGAAPSTQADHIVPASQGGGSDIENLRGVCARCNLARISARGGAAPRRT